MKGPAHTAALAALLVFGVASGLVLTEIGLRIAKRLACLSAGDKLFVPHPVWGWTHDPGAHGWTQGCSGRAFEWRAETRINTHGLRDREHPYARTPGVARVLLLGDSFTEGMQVPVERTFADLLEARLSVDDRPVEVINAGFSGFGTDNALLFYEAEGRRYEPDLVLLVFSTANDVVENAPALYRRMYANAPGGPLPKPHASLRRDGTLAIDNRTARRHWEATEAATASVAGRVRAWLLRHSHLARLVERVLAPAASLEDTAAGRRRAAAPTTAFGMYRVPPTPAWRRAWRLTETLIRGVRSTVEESGARFAVIVMPSKEAASPAAWAVQLDLHPALRAGTFDVDQPTRTVVDFLTAAGIPHLDLLPVLRREAAATGHTGYFAWDVHLDVEGHARVAEAVEPFLQEQLTAALRGHRGRSIGHPISFDSRSRIEGWAMGGSVPGRSDPPRKECP